MSEQSNESEAAFHRSVFEGEIVKPPERISPLSDSEDVEVTMVETATESKHENEEQLIRELHDILEQVPEKIIFFLFSNFFPVIEKQFKAYLE